jgi:2-isopropylmalate synthase
VIAAGATTINLPGHGRLLDAGRDRRVLPTIIARVPNADKRVFSAHCHDDLGLAVRTRWPRLAAGARQVECTINGIGERAGNASLEEIVMVDARAAGSMPSRPASRRSMFRRASCSPSSPAKRVQANKAIVGRNAFAHEAGIHQDGMLKDRRTYEIMRPEDVGVPQTTLVLGKHSGRHAVQKCCEQLGLTLSRRDLDEVYRAWSRWPTSRNTSDDDLASIAARSSGPSPGPRTPRRWLRFGV